MHQHLFCLWAPDTNLETSNELIFYWKAIPIHKPSKALFVNLSMVDVVASHFRKSNEQIGVSNINKKARKIRASECNKTKGTTKDMCEIDSIFRQLDKSCNILSKKPFHKADLKLQYSLIKSLKFKRLK